MIDIPKICSRRQLKNDLNFAATSYPNQQPYSNPQFNGVGVVTLHHPHHGVPDLHHSEGAFISRQEQQWKFVRANKHKLCVGGEVHQCQHQCRTMWLRGDGPSSISNGSFPPSCVVEAQLCGRGRLWGGGHSSVESAPGADGGNPGSFSPRSSLSVMLLKTLYVLLQI